MQKNPLPAAFKDVKYVNDPSYDQNCTAPDNNKCTNNASSLIYYVFYPKDHNYSGAPLKPIVFVHGYEECSSLDHGEVVLICSELARHGYVAMDVEYRKGAVLDNIDNALQQCSVT